MIKRSGMCLYLYTAAKLSMCVGLIALVPALATAQEGPQNCGFHSARGGFAFKNTGIFPDGSKAAFVGVMVFDGAGKVSYFNTGAINGPSGAFAFRGDVSSGTYKINPDCSGTLVLKTPPLADTIWDIVSSDNGKKLYGIVFSNGFVFTMEATKQ